MEPEHDGGGLFDHVLHPVAAAHVKELVAGNGELRLVREIEETRRQQDYRNTQAKCDRTGLLAGKADESVGVSTFARRVDRVRQWIERQRFQTILAEAQDSGGEPKCSQSGSGH